VKHCVELTCWVHAFFAGLLEHVIEQVVEQSAAGEVLTKTAILIYNILDNYRSSNCTWDAPSTSAPGD